MQKGYSPRCMGIALGVVCLIVAANAHALRYQFGDIRLSIINELIAGGTIRVGQRDSDLIGKLNLNPQLCPEDCLDLGGDNGNPQPNLRLVNAPGGFIAHLGDDGNLRFDQWELAAAQIRLESELTARWKDWIFNLSTYAFYDFINSGGEEYHPDNFQDVPPAAGNPLLGVPPTETAHFPRHTELTDAAVEAIGHDIDILEAFVSTRFDVFGQRFRISVGEQRIRWGKSLFNFLGSLDIWNPVNQNRLFFPGSEIATVFEPVGLVALSTRFSRNVNIQLIYQYDWEKTVAAAGSSLFGVIEAPTANGATLSLGQFSEAPVGGGGFTNDVARVITSTSLGIPINHIRGQPEGGGQYGIRLNWYLPEINGGTELSFYAANFHSRLPMFNAIAANQSCTTQPSYLPELGVGTVPGLEQLVQQAGLLDLLLPDGTLTGVLAPLNNLTLDHLSTRALKAAVACGGFNGTGTVAQALQTLLEPLQPAGNTDEPLPLGTVKAILKYPEDIHVFGISFTTNLGVWSLEGEFAYRPNQPLAVQVTDVLFAALQPALPNQDINVLIGTIPSARHAVPDYVATRYRDNTVTANEMIKGFERFDMYSMDLVGLRIFGAGNWLGASQIIVAVELGATYVPELTDPQVLPIASLWMAGATHPSPGADGTGLPNDEADPRRFNPTQQTENYPTEFSAGYRLLIRIKYPNLIFGNPYNIQLAFLHDIYGIAPFPIQNYVEGTKEIIFFNTVRFTPSLVGRIAYQGFFGGEFNNRSDRDNIRFSLTYSF